MIAIDLSSEDRQFGDELAARYPEGITVVDGRAIDGSLTHWTLFISAAAMALAEVRKIVVGLVESRKHKSVTIKGVKLRGYSDEEVRSILFEIDKLPRGK